MKAEKKWDETVWLELTKVKRLTKNEKNNHKQQNLETTKKKGKKNKKINEPGSDRILKNILWLCYSNIYPGDLIEGREEVEEM